MANLVEQPKLTRTAGHRYSRVLTALHLHDRHLPALWFAGLANQLFWWTYAKAWWRSFTSACCCSTITFKVRAAPCPPGLQPFCAEFVAVSFW